MPLSFRDHAAAIRDAGATKTITIPVLSDEFLKQAKEAGVEVPEIDVTYRLQAFGINAAAEQAMAANLPLGTSIEIILNLATSWTLEDVDAKGNPVPWPLDREGLEALADEWPEAVLGIANNISSDQQEGKGSSSASRKRSSTRRPR